MNAHLLIKAYKAVVAGALALAVVASVTSYASGPAEEAPVATPTPTAPIVR